MVMLDPRIPTVTTVCALVEPEVLRDRVWTSAAEFWCDFPWCSYAERVKLMHHSGITLLAACAP